VLTSEWFQGLPGSQWPAHHHNKIPPERCSADLVRLPMKRIAQLLTPPNHLHVLWKPSQHNLSLSATGKLLEQVTRPWCGATCSQSRQLTRRTHLTSQPSNAHIPWSQVRVRCLAEGCHEICQVQSHQHPWLEQEYDRCLRCPTSCGRGCRSTLL
jgi:hypothetical protein